MIEEKDIYAQAKPGINPVVKEGEEGAMRKVSPDEIAKRAEDMEKMNSSHMAAVGALAPMHRPSAMMDGVDRAETTEERAMRWCNALQNMAREMRLSGFLSAADAVDCCADAVKQYTA